jgi:murein DD-endopeptidase
MVSLALDPPPSTRATRGAPRGGRRRAVLLVVVGLSVAAGVTLGRMTAPGGRFPVTVSRGATAVAPAAAPPAAATASAAAAPAPGPAPGSAPAAAIAAPTAAAPAAAPAASTGPRRVAAVLNGAFEDSLTAALPPEDRGMASQLTQVVNRLLVWDLQVSRDGRRGDRLEIVYAPAPAVAPGMPSSAEPVVEAVRYASQKLGKTLAAYRFQAPGQKFARYYRADGSELEERLVDIPVADYDQVTSLLRDGRRHKGVDFRTPVGTPVFATFDGVVERRNWNFAGNGNSLDLRDLATGRHAIYLHLDVIGKDMAPGRKVKKGEQIAVSGNSGHSFAPHLHYQLEEPNGAILDPFAVQATKRLSLDAAGQAGFEPRRAALDTALGGGAIAIK